MNQATLTLAAPTAATVDRTGYDIGWDHAQHGLAPPAELLHGDSAIYQGWMAGRAVLGRRAPASTRALRVWLQLRLQAWTAGCAFDADGLAPRDIDALAADRCPLLRVRLGGGSSDPAAAVVDRIDCGAAWRIGNVVTISRQASLARARLTVADAVRRARLADAGGDAVAGVAADGWWRIAALASFARPLPFAEAARLPLALLPPPGVTPVNAVQRLQALLTLQFDGDGWSTRTRAIAAMLPEHMRHDFNLFVGAIAPRVIEAGSGATDRRRALEDAWLNERVQRRWQHLVFSLGESGVAELAARLDRAAEASRRRDRCVPAAVAAAGVEPSGRATRLRRPHPSTVMPAACA